MSPLNESHGASQPGELRRPPQQMVTIARLSMPLVQRYLSNSSIDEHNMACCPAHMSTNLLKTTLKGVLTARNLGGSDGNGLQHLSQPGLILQGHLDTLALLELLRHRPAGDGELSGAFCGMALVCSSQN